MDRANIVERDDVVIRFSGDSGDGMQLTGTLFSDAAAYLGNGISTFPDYPAEIRAPQGTVSGVSGFQVRFGSKRVSTPGDYCDVLVAMNPAALRANACWLKNGAAIILDGDLWNEKQIARAGFATEDPIEELGLEHFNIIYPNMTPLTSEALSGLELDAKSVVKCKNMFALGICLNIFNKTLDHTEKYIDKKFGEKKPVIAEANKLVLRAGYNYADNTHAFANTYEVRAAELEPGLYRSINGNQATALGFIAASEKSGRPLSCVSHPIPPATVILEALSKRKDPGGKTL